MTDEELVLAVQNGDNSAFEELYRKYKPIILSVARKFFLCGGEPRTWFRKVCSDCIRRF